MVNIVIYIFGKALNHQLSLQLGNRVALQIGHFRALLLWEAFSLNYRSPSICSSSSLPPHYISCFGFLGLWTFSFPWNKHPKWNNCVVLLQLADLLLPVLQGGDLVRGVCLGHLGTIFWKLIVSDGTDTKTRDKSLHERSGAQLCVALVCDNLEPTYSWL